MKPENSTDWNAISVTLPARYWIVVLGLVDFGVRQNVAPKLDELRKQGIQPSQLPDELKAALMGPVFARGEIVKTLHQAGVMTPEANLEFGSDALTALIRRFQNERGESS
jgi:hypothetical protein